MSYTTTGDTTESGSQAIGTLPTMGLDITVLIADRSWLEEVPPGERLQRLRDAWYDDETGFWDWDGAAAVVGDWKWPQGPNSSIFAVYEFLHTSGSFKAHFWAGQRWESTRDHVDPQLRSELGTLVARVDLERAEWRGGAH
ncbi:hypothetical protein [Streptomyces sp. TRM70350]|uniref:hypothetical protein n=1 Tax=Streptomyces sp. TRM70350 TaxID=2856165 RepID=UPI002110BFCB|nr:hypothetical protein [Streptomyces sp. TRM70350]